MTLESEFSPLIVLNEIVVFPKVATHLLLSKTMSRNAIKYAWENKVPIVLTMQNENADKYPYAPLLHKVGCIAKVLQISETPDGSINTLVEGIDRIYINYISNPNRYKRFYKANITPLKTNLKLDDNDEIKLTIVKQLNLLSNTFKSLPLKTQSATSYEHLVDIIVEQMTFTPNQKQEVLEDINFKSRSLYVIDLINDDLKSIQDLEDRNKNSMGRRTRSDVEEEFRSEINLLNDEIEDSKMSEQAKQKAFSELKKLSSMHSLSSETAILIKEYINTLLDLPWEVKSKINESIAQAKEVLNNDHYGLEQIKERIIEYIAVQQRTKSLKAPIICLVGPPGVGKTSLAQSIAKATNRKFIRMSLGGVRDEAEIRGHRRTYLASKPGKILYNMNKVNVCNPLFLLDEIDKISKGHNGDPAAALLEVLDPEQNHEFQDHYLEVGYDLSDVMFVATSNSMNIPPALLDRMEIIKLSSYTEDEKLNIALNHLIPKQIKNNGVLDHELSISNDAVLDIIRYYTKEAGVRSLEREINKICRKVVTAASGNKNEIKTKVSSKNLNEFLGVRRYDFGIAENKNKVGLINGLSWSQAGGDLLRIEAVNMPGKGEIKSTGSIGEVMKESVAAAISLIRSRACDWGIPDNTFEKTDIHVHFPEGAAPKEGPSAGIAITTAIVSTLTNNPARSDVAMTGEVTLHGEVLGIGGLKEKMLAALRGGIKKVIIPEYNIRDLVEIPDNIKNNLEIIPVCSIYEVLEVALQEKPANLANVANTIANDMHINAVQKEQCLIIKH